MEQVIRMGRGISPEMSSRIETMVQSVRAEFGAKTDELFAPVVVRMDSRQGEEFEATKWPGVYVFLHEEHGCLKVGKSHMNASKRALQHCSEDTSSKDGAIHMADLSDSDKTCLLVFSLKKRDSLHWVLALEHFLEKTEKPRISSQRNG